MTQPLLRRGWRGLVRNPLLHVAALLFAAGAFYLRFSGGHDLAAWWYGTANPTGAQVDIAERALVLLVATPILAFAAWLFWRKCHEERAIARRAPPPAYDDPSRRSDYRGTE